jgi:hypothetical protein
MRYVLIAACLFGIWCAATRFVPGLVMGMSLPVLLVVGCVATFFVSHRIAK